MKKISISSLTSLLLLIPVFGVDLNTVGIPANPSLKFEVKHALDKGAQWLLQNQADEGYWSVPQHPAVTALALSALKRQPDPVVSEKRVAVLDAGYRYLLDSVKEDGGIYREQGLLNYNTSVSVLAFVAAQDPRYDSIIQKARQFIMGQQSDYGEKGVADDPLDGGIGYGNSYPHPDMSNTVLALEALYHSRDHQSGDGNEVLKSLNIEAALSFLQNSQNLPSHNKQPWASGDSKNRGGFVYFPGNSKAGEETLPDGRVALRSYGSISYAGLLSYIYADLDPSDPRVKAVLDWLNAHFTLEENPGMDAQGLFYYYHTMAKALSAADVDFLDTADSGKVNWREKLALQLIDLQNTDGSWMNENGRWWEKDPALVTSYSMIALELIYRGL